MEIQLIFPYFIVIGFEPVGRCRTAKACLFDTGLGISSYFRQPIYIYEKSGLQCCYPILASLSVSRKFVLVLLIQSLLLVAVAALGWVGIKDSQSAAAGLQENLSKSKMINRALNDSNVLRTVHISMIAAAHNEAYLGKRVARADEYRGRTLEAIRQFSTLPWTEAERPLVDKGLASMKRVRGRLPGGAGGGQGAQGQRRARADGRQRADPARCPGGHGEAPGGVAEGLGRARSPPAPGSGAGARPGSWAWPWAGCWWACQCVRLVSRQITGGVKDLERTMSALHHGRPDREQPGGGPG